MSGRTSIRNVRIFDGQQLSEPSTIVIDGGSFGTDSAGSRIVDGGGAIALPGLIDAHLHLQDRATLENLTRWGVTTGLDMAIWPPAKLAGLRRIPGLTDIRSAGTPVMGAEGIHARMIPELVADGVLPEGTDPEEAVRIRIANGSDYLKLILEGPGDGGPDPTTARAFLNAGHRVGKLVVAHAESHAAFALAVELGADIVAHVPLGEPLEPRLVAAMARAGTASTPTLIMMESIAAHRGTPQALQGAFRSIGALHAADVPILAGSDANSQAGIEYGVTLHRELELLVDAGLTATEALRAATSLPARHFGLEDRGRIEPGRRADLVLVDGDPTADIRTTRNIFKVWCGGTEHGPF
ncbi:amidohydrolase family protein [Nocardia sp. NPDC051756]|uniref:amidohydrolase family protein n=1 Tax=Nocardia sp. NPDC051756 TaxID=3154751 RepID=UPI0034287C2A